MLRDNNPGSWFSPFAQFPGKLRSRSDQSPRTLVPEAEYLSLDQLAEWAANLEGRDQLGASGPEAAAHRQRLEAIQERIAKAYRANLTASTAGELISPAAEWLLDNYLLIAESIAQVRRDLPARFYRQLPAASVGDSAREPWVLHLARFCAEHSHYALTRERVTAVAQGFQKVRPLRIGELWATPPALRFVLLEELAFIADRIERARQMRVSANTLADELANADAHTDWAALLSEYDDQAANDTFAGQLLYRLGEDGEGMQAAVVWLERHMDVRETDAEEVIIGEQNRQSAGNVRIGNVVRSLRAIDDIDWSKWLMSVSVVDARLRERSDFAALDFASQSQYRRAIENLARWSRASEPDVAVTALDLADAAADDDGVIRDVGSFFIGPDRPRLEQTLRANVPFKERAGRYIRSLGWLSIAGPVALVTLGLVMLAFWALDAGPLGTGAAVALALLALLPASEAATGLFNVLATMRREPTRLVGYDFSEGIPAHARTMVVIPCLFSSRDAVEDLVRNLEVHHLSNPKGDVSFALLSDWMDSPHERTAEDDALLDYAREQVAELSERYAHDGRVRFHVLHRARLFNPVQGVWMGWERKRGKLMELSALLRGDPDTTFLDVDTPLPEDVKYVMTLDADTRMTRDAVARLVGKMEHPLNQPQIDPETGRVTRGYGVMQPRVTPSLTTGEDASAFQRIFSINRGFDPYVFTVSDVYQDLADEGSFTGKGLFHVDTFRTLLDGEIAENTVLSHDLLEGGLARCALVTDVELAEDFPTRYEIETARQHRWARGDWQLLPFLFGTRPRVSPLNRWKMIDNLRRSLVPIAWLAASILGWLVLGLEAAIFWQALLVLSLFVSPTLGLIRDAMTPPPGAAPLAHLHSVMQLVSANTAQVLLRVVFIAHSATVMTDAITRTLYRIYVSRRNLLEWSPASTPRLLKTSPFAYWASMRWSLAISIAALAATIALDGAWPVALAFTVLWVAAPWVAWALSRSAENEDRLEVTASERARLRKIARRTWTYFETFVTAEHNWLPPDNFQEDPEPVVAARTSPTNIGLYLLSVVAARDFGWAGLSGMTTRLERTVDALDRLEKHNGHLYNWYDTRRAVPLHPRYVSTVDSGNLAGHLIAVSAACAEWAAAPVAPSDALLDGIADAAGVLKDEIARIRDDRRMLRPLRHRVNTEIDDLLRAIATLQAEPEIISVRILNLSVIADNIGALVDDYHAELGVDASAAAQGWARMLGETCQSCIADFMLTKPAKEDLRNRLRVLAQKTREMAFKMDFRFLMRRDRLLLSIGFRPEDDALDESCYDLLASEARLASFFGIAKGDLPTEHWFRLGRPVVPVGARGSLMSWSGSMFEYLMPPLVMKEQQGGILNQSNYLAVRRQIEYGRARRLPWGVSESAFNARDPEMTYQYMTFGVPSLGMKRGLASQAVIAPYATILASQFKPRAALENLERLNEIGALGQYGYYDAIDYTPMRLPANEPCVIVRNFMAHHHGMSIVAIANVVHQGRLRERFHSDPVIEATELLLQERAPRAVPKKESRLDAEPVRGRSDLSGPEHALIEDPTMHPPAAALLSNGHYSLLLSARGSGRATWNGQAVNRWRPDPVEPGAGPFLFLRDMETGAWWSTTAEPRHVDGETTRTIISDSKVEYHKTVGTLRSEVDIIVASDRDAEGRLLTLTNTGFQDRLIEVTSYCEPVIGPADADFAHPVFSKMFVRTEIAPDRRVIHALRNPRRPDEPQMRVAHMLVDCGSGVGGSEAETDRRAFIGRGRTLGDAAAFDPQATLTGAEGFTLDPIFALRRTLLVPAGKKARLIFWTIAAPSREEIDEAVAYFRHEVNFEHESMQAWTRSQIQLRHANSDLAEAAVFQRLARYLVWPGHYLKTGDKAEQKQQSSLWPMGISGDHPIMVLRIDDMADIAIARKAMRAQDYFRSRGLFSDLVIVNERAASYAQDLQTAIDGLAEKIRMRSHFLGSREHIFTLRRDTLADESYDALMAVARIVLHARNGKFSTQIARAEALVQSQDPAPNMTPADVRRRALLNAPSASVPEVAGDDLRFWNGFGGFSEDGREYVVRLTTGEATPQPWINVMSNGDFGCHISAEGAGFTWSCNSRDHHLTPWSNDPVINRPGETLHLVDRTSRQVYTPYATLSANPDARFEIRHGAGTSTLTCNDAHLTIKAQQVVDPEDPVKLTRVTMTNDGSVRRRFRLYHSVEWVMGNSRDKTAPMLQTREEDGILLAENPYSTQFPGRVAFVTCDAPLSSHTVERAEFLGSGSVFLPGAVINGEPLSNTATASGDPCGAIAVDVDIGPGESRAITLLLGDAQGSDAAIALAQKHRGGTFDTALTRTTKDWDDFLGVLQVETPDPAFDVMINRWLPYQTLSCRITARSAFYQASGAFGFRDQLQDTLSMLLHDPTLARAQILNAAGRQFAEGDVQHWWLPETGAGVRTMISDDVVWLTYGITQYVEATGDAAILDEDLPFLEGPELDEGEHDRFFQPEVSDRSASLYEHAALALDLAIDRTGSHGLSLILGGDWNDGMNRVGEAGRGESVWLSWFLAHALDRFAPVAEARGDTNRASRWRAHLGELKSAIEGAGWDGGHYRRGYYDDGTPLGSLQSDECRIDSIAQSWSVMSGQGDPARQSAAMDQVLARLVDHDANIVKLFTPPFAQTLQEPGYIKGYPPGVRENGGQYTHAATWSVYALAMLGRGDEAKMLFDMLNPVNHALTRDAAETYRVEPYVVAADVYSSEDKLGRGGWTWYTGSGGWLYRAGVEAILGIRRRGDRLSVTPALPSAWPGYKAVLKLDGKTFRIDVADGRVMVNGNESDPDRGTAI